MAQKLAKSLKNYTNYEAEWKKITQLYEKGRYRHHRKFSGHEFGDVCNTTFCTRIFWKSSKTNSSAFRDISCRDGGHEAIYMKDGKPVMYGKLCVGCHLCVLVCPSNAIRG